MSYAAPAKFTHNSLATTIAWASSCLLAGGVSTLFSDSARTMWLIWGTLGLVSAVGLDVVARFREHMRLEELKRIATNRFERDLHYVAEENEANAAIREAVARILGGMPRVLKLAASRRTQERHPCDLDVEILLHRSLSASPGKHGTCTRIAKISNLSDLGFELKLAERIPPQRITMIVATVHGGRITLLGEVLWCSPQPDESLSAGGRFLNVISVEGE